MSENRTDALLWWNDLSKDTQEDLFEEYRGFNFSPAVRHQQLIGKEIEAIYNKITNK